MVHTKLIDEFRGFQFYHHHHQFTFYDHQFTGCPQFHPRLIGVGGLTQPLTPESLLPILMDDTPVGNRFFFASMPALQF